MLVKKCRLCGGKLITVLNMGRMPIVNYFPTNEEVTEEKKYPLRLCSCFDCGLLQLSFLLSPEELFKNYHYISGASLPLVEHLRILAEDCYREFSLDKNSQVIDIGCNDGSFLKALLGKAKLWGVDPSENATEFIKKKDINIVNDYFDSNLAQKIKAETGGFNLVVATHTLACVRDIKDFAKGVKHILKREGVVVVEVGSGSKMIENANFDFIYHEHYSYFDLYTLKKLFAEVYLEVFRVEENEFHGGSIRIYLRHAEKIPLPIKQSFGKLRLEKFRQDVLKHRRQFQKIIKNLGDGRLVIISVPAKGVSLLNYCNVSSKKIRFVADSTIQKQGRVLPGIHSLICDIKDLIPGKNDVYLILAWNYREVILEQVKRVAIAGSFVLVLFPKIEMVKI